MKDHGYNDSPESSDRRPVADAEREQSPMVIFAGSANRPLAERIFTNLHNRKIASRDFRRMASFGKAMVGRFSDGEAMVEIIDSVRGTDAFIVQPTSTPVDQHLMELLVMIDALKRASAWRVTAVVPYLGYARQDRRPRASRVAISAKVVANMISGAGADRVLTMDLHADQIQGFFNIPVDNIYASPVLVGDIWKHGHPDLMVVSPDVGGVGRARAVAKRLDDADLAIIDKRRPQTNQAEVMNIIGDVHDRSCVIVDDIADTAGTLCNAAAALKKNGALRVVAYCTHAVLSGKAVSNIENSALDELVVTNSIRLGEEASACSKIRQLCVADLLAESMRRINEEESIGTLFMD